MKKRSRMRVVIQIAFFVLIALIAVNHSLVEEGKGLPLLGGASLHAVCPFGGVVTLYELATTGRFVQKVHESSLVLMIIVLASAVFLGPAFCGWICPFGTFQELLGRIGKTLMGKRYNRMIPAKLDHILRYLRYAVLALVLFMTAWSGKLFFGDVDPYFALFQFWTGEVALTALILLGVVMVLSLFVERPFCKYACPYGAVLGLFNLLRIVPLKRMASTCTSCSACDRACPMNLPISGNTIVRNHQCISCFECTSTDGACPIPKTLEFRVGGKKDNQ